MHKLSLQRGTSQDFSFFSQAIYHVIKFSLSTWLLSKHTETMPLCIRMYASFGKILNNYRNIPGRACLMTGTH